MRHDFMHSAVGEGPNRGRGMRLDSLSRLEPGKEAIFRTTFYGEPITGNQPM